MPRATSCRRCRPARRASQRATLFARTDTTGTTEMIATSISGGGTVGVLVPIASGLPPSAALTRAVCARPGRLILDDDRLIVAMSAAHVELAHRRAGLDHDPGRAPWLRRAVTFLFQGGDEL